MSKNTTKWGRAKTPRAPDQNQIPHFVGKKLSSNPTIWGRADQSFDSQFSLQVPSISSLF